MADIQSSECGSPFIKERPSLEKSGFEKTVESLHVRFCKFQYGTFVTEKLQ